MKMNRLTLAGPRVRRLFSRQGLFILLGACTLWFIAAQFRSDTSQHWSQLGLQLPGSAEEADMRTPPKRMPTHNILPALGKRELCYGPRGHLLGKSSDDDLTDRELDGRM